MKTRIRVKSYGKMHLLIRIIQLIKGNDSGGHCAKLKPILLSNFFTNGRKRVKKRVLGGYK